MSTQRIGWIGTGVMGSAMCGRLMDAGYVATVHNRTRSKAEPLLARGAQWAETPQAVAENSDVIFSIVGYPSDVREVILSPKGALAGCREGSIIVDMTTSEPSLAEEIAAKAAERHVVAIDAPVTGGDIGAKKGTLSIMIGGDEKTVQSLEPFWKAMGSKWVRHGGPGAGQRAKLANQTLVGMNMIGVCESLLYAHRAGLDLNAVLESISSGAAGSWALSNLAPKIVRGDFAPGFFVEHLIKDLEILLDECRRMNLHLPGVELAERLFKEVAAQGHSRDGTQSLIFAVAKMNGEDWASAVKKEK
jgi:3-hydroxyisobutyrate dehydrogenase